MLVAFLAGCGGSVAAPEHVAPAAVRPAEKRICRAGVESRLGSRRAAYAAIARRPLRAYRKPGRAASFASGM